MKRGIQRIKLRRSQRIKEGEAHTRNQISGILMVYIIIIAVITVNVCHNKVL